MKNEVEVEVALSPDAKLMILAGIDDNDIVRKIDNPRSLNQKYAQKVLSETLDSFKRLQILVAMCKQDRRKLPKLPYLKASVTETKEWIGGNHGKE